MNYALVPNVNPEARSTVQIVLRENPWGVVDAWAQRKGFRVVGQQGNERIYQKGHGFWVAPMMCGIRTDEKVLTLQAWVRANLFVRLMSLFILPAEMHVRSGGFRAVVPRKIARDAINPLIEELGGQPIP